ncbi:MAG: SGNH/GDSL hydrolase family protein [Myxococcota bacterium]
MEPVRSPAPFTLPETRVELQERSAPDASAPLDRIEPAAATHPVASSQTPILETPGSAEVVRSRLELPPDPLAAREVAREYLSGPAGRAFVQSGRRFEHVPGEPAPRSDIIKAVQAFLYDDPAEWDGVLGGGTGTILGRQQSGDRTLTGATVQAALAGAFVPVPVSNPALTAAFRADVPDPIPDEIRIAPGDRVLVIGDSHVGGLFNLGLRDGLARLEVNVTRVDQPGAQVLHYADPDYAVPGAEAFHDLHERYAAALASGEYDHVIVSSGTNDEIIFGKFQGPAALAGYAENTARILEMARSAPGAPNVYWVGSPRLPETGSERVGRVGVLARSTIRDTVRGTAGAYYFPTHGYALPLQQSGTDVHPTNSGYADWSEMLMGWMTASE